MERRKFLQNTCPTVTFAFFGISFIQACSKSDDESSSYSSNSNNSNDGVSQAGSSQSGSSSSSSGSSSGGSSTSGSSSDNGITSSGNTVTLDLTNSTFSNLNNPGDFVNLTSVNLLVLKISNSEFRAFDNCCPHQGARNNWTFSNDQFKCNNHGNSFNIDGNDEKSCNSGSTTGGLKRYTASLSGDTLTITTS
jgi:Rieske Fe-S protein